MKNKFLVVLSPILRYHHAQNRVYVIRQTSLEIERQSHLPEVIYILRKREYTYPKITNNFLELLSPILRYHHAQNQG